MLPLLGPILAQIVTLGVADRTEARYIDLNDNYTEAQTTPRVNLALAWKHSAFQLGYGPSLTVTPLGSDSRNVLLLHTGVLSISHRWARTQLTISEVATYGEMDFRTLAFGNAAPVPPTTSGTTPTPTGTTGTTGNPGQMTPPPTSGATPGTNNPATSQYAATDRDRQIPFESSSTDVTVTNNVSQAVSVQGGVGYVLSGSTGSKASSQYPVVKGPRAQAAATYRPTRRDNVTTSVSLQYAATKIQNNAWILLASESWAHAIDRHTSTTLGAGLSTTRDSRADGYVAYSVYPTFTSGILLSSHFARGVVSLSSTLSAAPVIDPIRASADPRLALALALGWTKERFSSVLSGSSQLSLSDSGSTGALNSMGSVFALAYRFGDAISMDSGVRGFWQSFEGQTTIPPSYAAFVGLSFGLQTRLNH